MFDHIVLWYSIVVDLYEQASMDPMNVAVAHIHDYYLHKWWGVCDRAEVIEIVEYH